MADDTPATATPTPATSLTTAIAPPTAINSLASTLPKNLAAMVPHLPGEFQGAVGALVLAGHEPEVIGTFLTEALMLYAGLPSFTEQERRLVWQAIATAPVVKTAGLSKRPAAVFQLLQHADKYGYAPGDAFSAFHMMDGRIMPSAATKRALVQRLGHRFVILKDGPTEVSCYVRRADGTTTEPVSYTWADAERAGLTGGVNYRKHPRQMLFARASSLLVDRYFPEVVGGSASADEIDAEIEGREAAALADGPDLTWAQDADAFLGALVRLGRSEQDANQWLAAQGAPTLARCGTQWRRSVIAAFKEEAAAATAPAPAPASTPTSTS